MSMSEEERIEEQPADEEQPSNSLMVPYHQAMGVITTFHKRKGSGKSLSAYATARTLGAAADQEIPLLTNMNCVWPHGPKMFFGRNLEPVLDRIANATPETWPWPSSIMILDEAQTYASTLDPRSKQIPFLYGICTQVRKPKLSMLMTCPEPWRLSGVIRPLVELWAAPTMGKEDTVVQLAAKYSDCVLENYSKVAIRIRDHKRLFGLYESYKAQASG